MSSEPGDPSLFRFVAVHVVDGATTVLDGFDAVFPRAGITVLVGPSGAGKSTVLRLCNRLSVATSGRVEFRGDDVATLDPLALRRRVGMVFQRPALFGGTVRDNLAVADQTASDEELVAVLTGAGFDPALIDRPASVLSGGEAQRLCLARARLTGPEVLLMDEPTAALDPEHRAQIEALATAEARAGMPVVWVTHDLAQAARLADHTIVMVRGRVAEEEQAARYLSGDITP